jgi:predicted transcriptional regulator
MKRTLARRRIAEQFLESPGKARWAYELADSVFVDKSSVNTILQRMFTAGWLTEQWEDGTPTGRPRRRYFRATELGLSEMAVLTGVAAHETNRKALAT